MEEVDRYYQGNITLEEAENYIASGLITAARAYVANGYYLRRIRDDRLYEEAGYKNFEEYVRAKYNKDKGWASKCIKVNQELSADGNSPILISNYQDYSVYQLVEIAYMTEEQREEADPDMTVQALKEIRNPKPRAEEKVVTSQLEERSVEPEPDAEAQQIEESIAISQQDPEKLSAYGTSIKVYPEDSLLTTPGCEGGHDCFLCHLQCDIRQEYCRCVEATTGNPFPCEQIERIDTLREEIGERCQFIDLDQAYHRAGDHEPVPCCKECKEPCQYACERSIKKREAEEQTPEPETPQPQPDPAPPKWKTDPTPCIHREGYSCTVPEAHKHIPGDGSNCGRSCCWECTKRGECKWECNSSQLRPEEPEQVEPEPDALEIKPEILHVYEDQAPDESWKFGSLPQAKEKYIKNLARVLVEKKGKRLRYSILQGDLSDETVKWRLEDLADETDRAIEVGDDVIAYPCAEIIEFSRGDEDLGTCSYTRFGTQVRKAFEEWRERQDSAAAPVKPADSDPVIDADYEEIPQPAKELKPARPYTLEEVAKEIERTEAIFLGVPDKDKESVAYRRHIMRLDAMKLLYDSMKE